MKMRATSRAGDKELRVNNDRYMGENDFNTVSMIASERNDIGITASSTPSGARGVFYRMCTDKRPISEGGMGYSEHYHPSQDNPYYTKEMDDRERAECTQTQYEHEILAIFGTEEAGVFDKSQVDAATKKEFYIYNPLTDIQKRNLKDDYPPTEYLYTEDNPAPYNPFRCMGIDWDSTQAGSSLLILDFDTTRKSFKVIKTVEVPRGEYTLDKAVQWVVKLNQIYRPSWIFCDRGYGDYQIERLHIYGDEHPASGLKNKVVGYQFKQTIDVLDPITREMHKEPMKQFMVNQLKLSFERDRMILCPFDETLHKQLIDYCVDRVSQSGLPIYTSVNEHFVDALGLAHLAFVLKFPDLTAAIKTVKNSVTIAQSHVDIINRNGDTALREISSVANPWAHTKIPDQIGKEPGERRGDYQKWVKVPMGARRSPSFTSSKWNRGGGGGFGRSFW